MPHALDSFGSTSLSQPPPRTVAEAVDRLALVLAQAEKEAIAGMAEGDLTLLHFGLGMWIRNEFGLWQEDSELLADCERIKLNDSPPLPQDLLSALPKEWFEVDGPSRKRLPCIHPDDASGLVIRALWARLRH